MRGRISRTPPTTARRATPTTSSAPRRGYQYDDLPGGSAADYPGQRTKITYPDGKTVTYTYDQAGNMKTVTDWLNKQSVYYYGKNSLLTKGQLPNGTWTEYLYDNANRLTSVVNKGTGPVTISSFAYTLDAVGNRTQMVDLSGTSSYQYDPLYRLTQATYPGTQTDTYSYDANGNRLTKNATTYTYDAADQMTATGGVNYGYDNNGNQTTRASDTFTYDHENRLTQSVISGVTSSSVYKGDGLRMSHTVSGQTTSYTWDVGASLPVVLQDGTNTYVYGLDLISATDTGGVQTYFLYDGLGSTANLTDGSGNTTASYSYDVFGAIRSQSGGGSNQWLFTGEQRDGDSGLYYLRARYYDPAIGRFPGRDPLPAGNLYAYVGSNPVNWIDPTGLHCKAWHPHHCVQEVVEEVANEVTDVAVFSNNAPFTAPAVVYGLVNGGSCDIDGDLFITCSSMSGGTPRGGITIGNVFLTEKSANEITSALLGHEKIHSGQWAVYGGAFPALYFGNEFVGWILSGPSYCWNIFEKQAGFEEGNYDCEGKGFGPRGLSKE